METPKSLFVKLELTHQEKELFEKASQLAGYQALSDFIFAAMEEKAKRIFEDNGQLYLSNGDQEVFFDAILNPLEPNEDLKKAAAEYKALLNRS